MADQEQLAAFVYHWRAAGLAETTLRYYLSWLGRLDVDDSTTDLAGGAAGRHDSASEGVRGAGCEGVRQVAGVQARADT